MATLKDLKNRLTTSPSSDKKVTKPKTLPKKEKINSNSNKDDEFQYEELRFLLKLVAESNFQGTDIQVLYNIVLKLQNKMKKFIEEND